MMEKLRMCCISGQGIGMESKEDSDQNGGTINN
jgi:hypothetical protein